MGRNRKTGLDYFPFDVDTFQDIKIRKLIKYQSGKAVTVYALLLCLIYKGGYYMRWDEELPFIISEQTGFEEAYIQEVIKSCMVLGLFSKELFDKERVLTSKGIQERYRDICKQINRKCDFVEFSLISSEEKPISSEEMPVSSEEKRINSEKSTQKKRERKEKEKEKKDINLSSFGKEECDSRTESPLPPPSEPPSEKIPIMEIADMWNSTCPNLSKVERITDKRKRKIPIRVKEMGGWEKARPMLEEIFRKVSQSNFLNGDSKSGWTCSFDWIFENGTNWVNIHEGRYDNARPRAIERRSSIDVSTLTQRQTNFYNFLLRNGEFLLNMPVFPTDEEIGNLNSIPKPELTEIVKEINNKTYLLNGRTSIYETILEIKNKRNGT